MKMNFNKILYLPVILILIFSSCNESEDVVTENAKAGGLLQMTSGSLNYVVGNPEGPYTIEAFVNQGKVKTETINVYRSFTSIVKYEEVVDGDTVEASKTFVSNEVLDRTIDITESVNHHITFSYTLDDLIEGLSISNLAGTTNPLPDVDAEYQIGDRWILRIESVLSDGRTVQQSSPVSVAVSTRYAGTYRTLAAEYHRFTGVWDQPVGLSGWPAETVIESVDATTYKVVEYFGPFDNNEFYFQIDPGTGKITYPDKTPDGDDQLGNALPFITCEANAADMIFVHCDESNVVVDDDVTGKDRLIMSFGYMGGNGPRTFYQVLEKIVD